MPTTCQFKFSRPTPIYYSDEQITGSFILSTTKQLPVEAIQLSLIGTERVQWLARSRSELILHNDSTDKDNKVLYEGKRENLYDSHTLAKRVRLLPREVLIEEFCFTLPHDTLASCAMKYGEVVYYVQVTLQRKSVFNKVFKARITVKNRLDLNTVLELGKPHKILIANVLSSADQSLCFVLPNGVGYVPGQSISYTLQGRHIFGACNKVHVNLCQRSTFRATTPQMEIKEVCTVLKSDIQKISSSFYVNIYGQISIPLTTCISMRGKESDLIQISNYVEAMLINKKRILQKFIAPILVGTVPLESRPPQMHAHGVDYFYCYDNLAADANRDKTSENDSFKTNYLNFVQASPSALNLKSGTS